MPDTAAGLVTPTRDDCTQHEPPSPAADDHSFVTPDSYILIATVAGAVLGALGTWLLVRKLYPRGPPIGPSRIDNPVAACLQGHDDAIIDALRGELGQTVRDGGERTKEALDQQTAELEARTTRMLGEKIEAADERTKEALDRQTAELETRTTRMLGEQIEAADERTRQAVDALEARFQEALAQRIKALEAQTEEALETRATALEATLRQHLGKRVDEVEDGLRAKVNKEAFDALYAALGRRVEALEAGVRILDSRQLDQEACGVGQRALGRRLDGVEASARALDARADAAGQRLDALDDGLRVADCRGRAAGQRLDALEDNVGAVDGQTTLLAHDVERGRAGLDRLARQVRVLPGADRLRALVDEWEARFGALEAHVAGELAEAHGRLLEAAPPAPELSWSPLVAQEIEPACPLYTDADAASAVTTPHDRRGPEPGHHRFGYMGDVMPPTPSPSDRSHSSRSNRTSSSLAGRDVLGCTPTGASKRKKLEEAGFKEPTFASRQRLYHARTGSSAA